MSLIVNKITQIKKTGSTKGASHVIESLEGLGTKLADFKVKVRTEWSNCLVQKDD